MTMQKLRIIPWLVGIVLILTTLAGANRLLHSDPASSSGGGAPPKPPTPAATSDGLVAKGTVHSDPPTVTFILPPHFSAGRLAEVFVNGGQEVKANDPLVRFEDWQFRLDLEKAQATYNATAQAYAQADSKQKQHA